MLNYIQYTILRPVFQFHFVSFAVFSSVSVSEDTIFVLPHEKNFSCALSRES